MAIYECSLAKEREKESKYNGLLAVKVEIAIKKRILLKVRFLHVKIDNCEVA